MSVDLTGYTSVRTSLFVRLDIAEYRTSPTGTFTQQILRFSDHYTTFSINSESYVPLGKLLTVTASSNEIRPSSNTVTVALSGIPNTSIAEIVNSKIKGSTVEIFRGYFDLSTNNIIGTIQGRYTGVVNNYGLEEEYDALERTATNTIQLECLSDVDVLSNKVAGRQTNPVSMKKYFPTDLSFDNIPSLKNSSFDFGAPR